MLQHDYHQNSELSKLAALFGTARAKPVEDEYVTTVTAAPEMDEEDVHLLQWFRADLLSEFSVGDPHHWLKLASEIMIKKPYNQLDLQVLAKSAKELIYQFVCLVGREYRREMAIEE